MEREHEWLENETLHTRRYTTPIHQLLEREPVVAVVIVLVGEGEHMDRQRKQADDIEQREIGGPQKLQYHAERTGQLRLEGLQRVATPIRQD